MRIIVDSDRDLEIPVRQSFNDWQEIVIRMNALSGDTVPSGSSNNESRSFLHKIRSLDRSLETLVV